MCECYKIGGPFIAEDPDCPIHGTEAQWEREQREMERQTLEERVALLEEIADRQSDQIRMLQEMIRQTGKE